MTCAWVPRLKRLKTGLIVSVSTWCGWADGRTTTSRRARPTSCSRHSAEGCQLRSRPQDSASFADYTAGRRVELQHFRFALGDINCSANQDLSRRPTDGLEIVDEESIGCPTDTVRVNGNCVRKAIDYQQIPSDRPCYVHSRMYQQL